jgi:hypothetical protein
MPSVVSYWFVFKTMLSTIDFIVRVKNSRLNREFLRTFWRQLQPVSVTEFI